MRTVMVMEFAMNWENVNVNLDGKQNQIAQVKKHINFKRKILNDPISETEPHFSPVFSCHKNADCNIDKGTCNNNQCNCVQQWDSKEDCSGNKFNNFIDSFRSHFSEISIFIIFQYISYAKMLEYLIIAIISSLPMPL